MLINQIEIINKKINHFYKGFTVLTYQRQVEEEEE